jgi:hypothetical protein
MRKPPPKKKKNKRKNFEKEVVKQRKPLLEQSAQN